MKRIDMEKDNIISLYSVTVESTEESGEICYITRQGENMCFEMSMCEFEKWLFYRHGIHSRAKKEGGKVGFLIRDITPPDKLTDIINEFLKEFIDKLGEIA